MPHSRILVVDNYEPFRRFLRWTLKQNTNLQVIAEASDGLEAVDKAKELLPDLILLDIALPKLNGILAAKRLRDIVPRAKILFLSIESASDIVQESFNVGGIGYIHKLQASSDLLPAIETVIHGNPFVSRSLSRQPAPRNQQASFTHEVAFYADDTTLADDFTRFIETNLNSGNVMIVAVTESHRRSIVQKMESDGIDIEALKQQGLFICLDARETLSNVMVNDWPSATRLEHLLNGLSEGTTKLQPVKRPRLVVCGELAPTLWVEGKTEAAIQLEHLWDQITGRLGIDTLCGYLSTSFHQQIIAQGFKSICAAHTASSFR